MNKQQYIARIAITTQNEHILPIAEAMWNHDINMDMGLEFLACWQNLNDSCVWSDDDNVCLHDECNEFTTANIMTFYLLYVEEVKPDNDADTIHTLRDRVGKLETELELANQCLDNARGIIRRPTPNCKDT